LILPEGLTKFALNLHAIEIEICGRNALGKVPLHIPRAYPQTGDALASFLHFDNHGELAFLLRHSFIEEGYGAIPPQE